MVVDPPLPACEGTECRRPSKARPVGTRGPPPTARGTPFDAPTPVPGDVPGLSWLRPSSPKPPRPTGARLVARSRLRAAGLARGARNRPQFGLAVRAGLRATAAPRTTAARDAHGTPAVTLRASPVTGLRLDYPQGPGPYATGDASSSVLRARACAWPTSSAFAWDGYPPEADGSLSSIPTAASGRGDPPLRPPRPDDFARRTRICRRPHALPRRPPAFGHGNAIA